MACLKNTHGIVDDQDYLTFIRHRWLFFPIMMADVIAGLTGSQEWVIAYVVVSLLSALIYIYLGRRWVEIELHYISLYIFIVVWSGMMYMAYLWETPLQHIAWYLDWFVTLPMLVFAIGLTAHCRDQGVDWSILGSAVGLQAMAVMAGIMAYMVPQGYPTLLMYLIGASFLGYMLFLLWGPMNRVSGENHPRLHTQYVRLVTLFSVVIVAYPVVWVLSSPYGYGVIPHRISTILLLFVVPVLMKPVMGLFNLWFLEQFNDPDDET